MAGLLLPRRMAPPDILQGPFGLAGPRDPRLVQGVIPSMVPEFGGNNELPPDMMNPNDPAQLAPFGALSPLVDSAEYSSLKNGGAGGAPLPPPRPPMDSPSEDDNAEEKPVAKAPEAPTAAAPARPAAAPAGPGFLDRLGDAGGWDMLMGLGAGIASGNSWGDGIGRGLELAQKGALTAAASSDARAKAAQARAALAANVVAVKKAIPGISDAEALATASNPATLGKVLERNLPSTEQWVTEKDADGNLVKRNTRNNDVQMLKAAPDKNSRIQLFRNDKTGEIEAVDKDSIFGEDGKPAADGSVPVRTVRAATKPKVQMWGQDGVPAPPGYPPGTPGYYDEDGKPHVGLTSGTDMMASDKAAGVADKEIIEGTIKPSWDKTKGALGTLKAIDRQKKAIDSGITSGWGANWQTEAKRAAAKLLGLSDAEVANDDVFQAASAAKSAELAKTISQAGHTTNMDLQLGATIAGGDRSKVEKALREIITAQERLARDQIEDHGKLIDRYQAIVGKESAPGKRVELWREQQLPIHRFREGDEEERNATPRQTPNTLTNAPTAPAGSAAPPPPNTAPAADAFKRQQRDKLRNQYGLE